MAITIYNMVHHCICIKLTLSSINFNVFTVSCIGEKVSFCRLITTGVVEGEEWHGCLFPVSYLILQSKAPHRDIQSSPPEPCLHES